MCVYLHTCVHERFFFFAISMDSFLIQQFILLPGVETAITEILFAIFDNSFSNGGHSIITFLQNDQNLDPTLCSSSTTTITQYLNRVIL